MFSQLFNASYFIFKYTFYVKILQTTCSEVKIRRQTYFFLIYHNHAWKKKSDYSAVLPLLLRWSTTIITATIASYNLIISNLMFSTKQLSKQGDYLQKPLKKLLLGGQKSIILLLWKKKRLKKLNSNVHINTTAFYLSKLGSTPRMNQMHLTFSGIRYQDDQRWQILT